MLYMQRIKHVEDGLVFFCKYIHKIHKLIFENLEKIEYL